MLAQEWDHRTGPLCKLITGSAALLVCGAALALPELQKEGQSWRAETVSRGRQHTCLQAEAAQLTA